MATAASEPAQKKHGNLIPWQPGQSGNPAGRARGSRNKLGEDFIEALHEDFQEHGAATIERARKLDPVQYLKVVASIVPKEVIHTPGGLDDIDDDTLERLFIEAALRAAGIEGAWPRAGTKALPAPMSDEPPLVVGSRSGPEGL
jgi:hypothetical protein